MQNPIEIDFDSPQPEWQPWLGKKTKVITQAGLCLGGLICSHLQFVLLQCTVPSLCAIWVAGAHVKWISSRSSIAWNPSMVTYVFEKWFYIFKMTKVTELRLRWVNRIVNWEYSTFNHHQFQWFSFVNSTLLLHSEHAKQRDTSEHFKYTWLITPTRLLVAVYYFDQSWFLDFVHCLMNAF